MIVINNFLIKSYLNESWGYIEENLKQKSKYNTLLTCDLDYPWGRVNILETIRIKKIYDFNFNQEYLNTLSSNIIDFTISNKTLIIDIKQVCDFILRFGIRFFHYINEEYQKGEFKAYQVNKNLLIVEREGVAKVKVFLKGDFKILTINNFPKTTLKIETERGYKNETVSFEPFKFTGKGKIIVTLFDKLDEILLDEKKIKNSLDNIYLQYLSKFDKYLFANAGYPWFEIWGRDTAIFLNYHLIEKNLELTKKIFDSLLELEDNGKIFNTLTYSNVLGYNSLDSTLWFLQVAYKLYKFNLIETAFIKEIFDYFFHKIQEWQEIKLNKYDNLPLLQVLNEDLTWMDAKNSKRFDYPIEIQGLWLSFLKNYEEIFNKDLQIKFEKFPQLYLTDNFFADSLDSNFNKINKLRPNVFFLLETSLDKYFLPFSKQLKNQLDILFTKAGLKTLSANDKDYNHSFKGTINQLDKAYHNGAIWPYLLYFAKKLISEEQKKEIANFFESHLKTLTLNHISEVFSPDDLSSGGTTAQLWNLLVLNII